MKDKTLKCKDCQNEFVFTVGEQEFYQEKGFTNEPVRCKECRDKKKNQRDNNNGFKKPGFQKTGFRNFNDDKKAA